MAWHPIALVVLVTAPATCQSSVEVGRCLGSFAVEGFSNLHLTGGGIQVAWDRLTLQHNSGASLTSSCLGGWDPAGFAQLRLLGHTISFEVDLSGVGCGCNLAVYLVEGPALDSAGIPSKGSCDFSPYYCDANQVCGQYCPEVDIMEANFKAFATTAHQCGASASPEYHSCDRQGRGANTNALPGSYGPGSGFAIDTRRPFEVRASFSGGDSGGGAGATFYKMTTELVQEGGRLDIPNAANAAYLNSMAGAMARGMSMRITYWGSTADKMSWLDTPPCGAQICNGTNAGAASISNMRVFPIIEGPPSELPSPPPPGFSLFFQRLDFRQIPWASVALASLVVAVVLSLAALFYGQWDCIKKELFGVDGGSEAMRARRTRRRAGFRALGAEDSKSVERPLRDATSR